MKQNEDASCHCGSGNSYSGCCGVFVEGEAIAPTAEQLMRSRYSAFVRCHQDYLLASWHPDTRPSRVRFDDKQRWLGLRIYATEAGGEGDTSGKVEYVARYKVDGKGHRLHELSRFEKIEGRWFYVDGEFL